MKRIPSLFPVPLALGICFVPAAPAFQPPARPPLVNFDRRHPEPPAASERPVEKLPASTAEADPNPANSLSEKTVSAVGPSQLQFTRSGNLFITSCPLPPDSTCANPRPASRHPSSVRRWPRPSRSSAISTSLPTMSPERTPFSASVPLDRSIRRRGAIRPPGLA